MRLVVPPRQRHWRCRNEHQRGGEEKDSDNQEETDMSMIECQIVLGRVQ
jgi:hypothetical protein